VLVFNILTANLSELTGVIVAGPPCVSVMRDVTCSSHPGYRMLREQQAK